MMIAEQDSSLWIPHLIDTMRGASALELHITLSLPVIVRLIRLVAFSVKSYYGAGFDRYESECNIFHRPSNRKQIAKMIQN